MDLIRIVPRFKLYTPRKKNKIKSTDISFLEIFLKIKRGDIYKFKISSLLCKKCIISCKSFLIHQKRAQICCYLKKEEGSN